mgnify:CR=1 FL=1
MQPHLYPTGNMVNTLLECVTASDVCDSVVNGQILMKDRQVQTLDERKILQNNLLIPEGTMKIILYLVVLLFGISLFDSIFIALPAAIGYLHAAAGNKEVFVLLPILLIAYGIGVFAGSKNATKINQKLLKQIVAVASIAIACIKLFL